jgi:hypothetical protein
VREAAALIVFRPPSRRPSKPSASSVSRPGKARSRADGLPGKALRGEALDRTG